MKRVRRYTEAEARGLLNEAVRKAGSQAAFADSHGISRQYLSDVLKGRRDISGKILDALGLTKITEFQSARALVRVDTIEDAVNEAI